MPVNCKYIEYSIENFIHAIIQEEIKKEEVVFRIKNTNINKELISKALQKVDFVYMRINKPLENDIKYLLLVFPFGIVNGFNQKGFFNVEENKRMGFVKKIKQYNSYSFIGLIIYTVIIILAVIFFK